MACERPERPRRQDGSNERECIWLLTRCVDRRRIGPKAVNGTELFMQDAQDRDIALFGESTRHGGPGVTASQPMDSDDERQLRGVRSVVFDVLG